MSFPWKLREDIILYSLGWWPNEDDPPLRDPDSIGSYLRFVVDSQSYSFATTPDRDGLDCVVVEALGRDRLVLSPDLGFAIRERETFDIISGRLSRRQVSSDFKRYSIDQNEENISVWLPSHVVVTTFKNHHDKSELANTVMIDIERIVVNKIPADAFSLIPPPGTLIANRDTGQVSQIPGGLDLLDETVADVRYILDFHARNKPLQNANRLSSPKFLLIVLMISTFILVAVFLLGVRCFRNRDLRNS